MERLIVEYELETKEWSFKGQRGFSDGFSGESQIISLFQDFVDEIVDAVIIDFAKAFTRYSYSKNW